MGFREKGIGSISQRQEAKRLPYGANGTFDFSKNVCLYRRGRVSRPACCMGEDILNDFFAAILSEGGFLFW